MSAEMFERGGAFSRAAPLYEQTEGHAAHRSGITHRDLRPGNVMLTSSEPKLLALQSMRFITSSTS